MFLCIVILTSCNNFLKGGETKKQIEDSIAYANAQSCKLYLKSDPAMGSFLANGEKECKVGYSTDLQFTLKKDDYYFVSLQAVSTADESQSREEYVEFTLDEKASDLEKGIYIIKVKLLKPASDILIRPVCLELPCVKSYYPSSTEPQAANTSIIITFNMPVEDEAVGAKDSLFRYENKNILLNYTNLAGYNVDMSQYFEQPVFNSSKTILTLCPKGGLLSSYIKDEEKLDFIDISISFSEDLIVKNDNIDFKLKQDSNSNFTVRYNSDKEETAPVCRDFFIAKDEIKIADVPSFADDKKLILSKKELEGDENIRNLTTPTVYIYGKYYDKDSGVRTIEVKEEYTYSLSVLNPYKLNGSSDTEIQPIVFTADSNNVELKSDENGYTEYVVKYTLKEFSNENPRSGVFHLTVTTKDGCNNAAEDKEVYLINLDYGDLSYYERINKENNTYERYTHSPGYSDPLEYYVPKPFFLYNTPFSKSSTDPNHYDFDKYYSDIKNIRIKDEVKPTKFRIYTDLTNQYPGYISCNDVKYICEYTDKDGKKRTEPFSDFCQLENSDTMERSLILDVDKVTGLSFTVIVEYEGIILGRKKYSFPAEPLMNAVEATKVTQKPLDNYENTGFTGIYQYDDGSYNLLYIPYTTKYGDFDIDLSNLSAGCKCYLGYFNGHSINKNYSYNYYSKSYDSSEYFKSHDRRYKVLSSYSLYNDMYNSYGEVYEDVLLGEIAGPFYKTQTAITKPAAPDYASETITKSATKAGYLDISLYFASNVWDTYDSIDLTLAETETDNVVKNLTINSENTTTADNKICFTFSLEQEKFYNKGKSVVFDLSLIGVKSFVHSIEKIKKISLNEQQQSAFDDIPPSELLIKHPRTITRKAVFYFYDNGSGPKEGIITLNGKSYGEMTAGETGSNTFIIEIPYYKFNVGNNIIGYELYDKKGLKTEGSLIFNPSSYKIKEASTGFIENVDTDTIAINSDLLKSVYNDAAYLELVEFGSNNKWDTTIRKFTKVNIELHPGSESEYQLENLNLTEGHFYKVNYYRPASSTEKEYLQEKVFCALAESNQGNEKLNYVLANGTDNKTVVISSEKDVYINLCSSDKPYATCKDWSADMWEMMKAEPLEDYDEWLNLSGGPNPQVYEIPTRYFKPGYCYCIVVHFANGKVVRSQIMY